MAGKEDELSEPDSKSTGSEAKGGCGSKRKEVEHTPLMEPDLKSTGSEAKGGRGSKRKAAEKEEAAAEVDVVVDRVKSEQGVLVRQESEEVVSEDDDEDPEISFARIRARYKAGVRRLQARHPQFNLVESSDEEDSDDDEEEEEVAYEYSSSDDDEYDPNEDIEISLDRIKARFEARVWELDGRFPQYNFGDRLVEEDSYDDDNGEEEEDSYDDDEEK